MNKDNAKTEIISLYKRFESQYEDTYATLRNLLDSLSSSELRPDHKDLADIGYIMRELETLSDSMRKEFKARKDLCSKLLGIYVAKRSMQEPSFTGRIKAEFCSATPEVKIRGRIPKKDSEEYKNFLQWAGVPEKIIEAEIFRLHWERLSDLLTVLHSQGKPMPPGLYGTFEDYDCVYRKHQGINIGSNDGIKAKPTEREHNESR